MARTDLPPYTGMGYQWPASRLTASDMQMLDRLRTDTGRPITQLLHETVSAYYASMTGEKPIDSTPPPPTEPPVFYDI
jgi:hypothetical protein